MCIKQQRGRGDGGRWQLRKGGRALRSRGWQEEKEDAGFIDTGKKNMKWEKDESGKDEKRGSPEEELVIGTKIEEEES